MAEQVKSLASRNGAGFRPGAMVVALVLSVALLGVFDLICRTHG